VREVIFAHRIGYDASDHGEDVVEPKEPKDQGSEPSHRPNGAHTATQDLSEQMLLRTQAHADATEDTDATEDADATENVDVTVNADVTEDAQRLLERQALLERAQRRGGWGGFVWSMTPPSWLRQGRFWWTDFVLIFVINFLVQLILYALWTAFFPQAKPSSVLGYTGLVLLSLGGQIVIAWLYVQIGRNIRGLTWEEMFWGWPTLRMTLWWVLIFFPSMMLFSWVYVFVLGQLGIASPKQAVAGLFHASNPIYLHFLAIVMVVVGAPIAEELLYRGVLFHALEPMWGMQRAALGSGLIFGLVHLEVGTFFPLGFLGYLLARAYAQSRSLWLPIFLHSVNNWIALLAVYLGKA